MEVLLSDKIRRMLADPDARRQLLKGMSNSSQKHIIKFEGKNYIMEHGGGKYFELEDLNPTEAELKLWNSLDSISKSHPLIRDEKGILRFKEDKITRFVDSQTNVNLADFRRQEIEPEDIKRYYRNIGSTLAGFCENFGKNKKS